VLPRFIALPHISLVSRRSVISNEN